MTESPTTIEITHTRRLHVVFCHLDLGIGGAEQLILQLCQASKTAGHRLDIVTTRCDADHCFASVKPNTGNLHPYLHVWGRWIPATLLWGKAKAACSAVRLLYLAWRIAQKQAPDVIVLDVLPLPLPFWQWTTQASLLFYCHFPDKLLVQQNTTGSSNTSSTSSSSAGSTNTNTRRPSLYRTILNTLEEVSLLYADEIAVNSKFTRGVVLDSFPRLRKQQQEQQQNEVTANSTKHSLTVLYPALDTASLQTPAATTATKSKSSKPLLVSLNRFERKKNLELVLHAAAWLRQQPQQRQQNALDSTSSTTKAFLKQEPRIIIAGGYDTHVSENVEYLTELQTLARDLHLTHSVEFQTSISDAQRAHLLRTATAVLYTPSNEHFGIVPLEAMYAETIVVANKSGGPVETVEDGVTGYLCETPTAEDWGRALQIVLQKDEGALQSMGRAARRRVMEQFSEERLCSEWSLLLERTVEAGQERLSKTRRRRLFSPKTWLYMIEGFLTLFLCWVLATLARLVFGLLMWLLSFGGENGGEL